MNFKKWAVSKVKDIVIDRQRNFCTGTKSGSYFITAYKSIKKFRTQADAREFRRTYTGKDRIQIVNTLNQAVSR